MKWLTRVYIICSPLNGSDDCWKKKVETGRMSEKRRQKPLQQEEHSWGKPLNHRPPETWPNHLLTLKIRCHSFRTQFLSVCTSKSMVALGFEVILGGLHYLYSSCRWLQTHTWTVTNCQEAQLLDSPSPQEGVPLRWGPPGAPTPLEGCWALRQSLWSRPEWRRSPTLMHPSLQRSPPSKPAHHPETEVSGKWKMVMIHCSLWGTLLSEVQISVVLIELPYTQVYSDQFNLLPFLHVQTRSWTTFNTINDW